MDKIPIEDFAPSSSSDRRFVETRSYNIQALWDHHHEIARRLALGQSNVEIAEQLNITPQTVSNFRNSPLGKKVLSQLQEQLYSETIDVAKRIQDFAPKALALIEEIIEGKHKQASLALRAKYASQHLGRAGYGELKKVAIASTSLSRDEIDEIKQRAREASFNSGVIERETRSQPEKNVTPHDETSSTK
jgi:Bacterial regulatory proteins, luxR family